jgi:decaprenylphospho-beta-D-ribofuranose 2-oxidase
VIAAADGAGVSDAISQPGERGVLARGLGRSYGDAAQNGGGVVIDTTVGASGFSLDGHAATVTAAAGTSLDAVLRAIVPAGFFVPVTPGTRHVTIGGAIAADIHGKNHHRDGSFARHLISLTMRTADDQRLTLSPTSDPEAFWATTGGLGLTGVIESATFTVVPIATSRLLVDTTRAADLDETMALMAEADDRHRYSVAWIDLLARGRSLGRSVLTAGDFAPLDALTGVDERAPHHYDPHPVLAAPPWVPSGLLNRLSIRAFNELWFRKAPQRRTAQLQSIGAFFHPLDAITDWNRLYGRRGFVQHQTVVPFGAEGTLRAMVERLAGSGSASFLAVLKRFGAASPGALSFPLPGWTLALDLPVGSSALGSLLDELDVLAVEAGGRVYLAKDGRVRADLVPMMYPRLDEWRAVRHRLDPEATFQSDLARRLDLIAARTQARTQTRPRPLRPAPPTPLEPHS